MTREYTLMKDIYPKPVILGFGVLVLAWSEEEYARLQWHSTAQACLFLVFLVGMVVWILWVSLK
jgi:hypothetical protein